MRLVVNLLKIVKTKLISSNEKSLSKWKGSSFFRFNRVFTLKMAYYSQTADDNNALPLPCT